jgi:adenylate kinase family enzyme
MAFPYQRVIIIGTTSSGKSTLAEQISKQFGLDLIELDALHWLPDWEHRSDQDFRALVAQATASPKWVMAGNYSVARDISWPRAEAIVWLDYSLWTIFWRLWQRTWRRWQTQELLWGTNREKLWPHFKLWSPDDSLFAWLFATYWRRKREYPPLFVRPEYAHLQVLHMCSPQETEMWLRSVSRP